MTRVETTQSLGNLMLAMLPAGSRQSLARCAVPQSFDAEVYKGVLRAEGGPDLAELIAGGQVKPYGLRDDRYAVSEMLRGPALAQWWSTDGQPATVQPPVPTELAALAAQLAEASRAANRPLEQLDLSVLAGPGPGADTFTELFAAADERHDLPMCRALLDVLDSPERRPLLDARLGGLRNEAALRLSSRSMWTTAFYESARYVARPVLEEPLEGLLAGEPSRVLQFYADGGMGKTMQVRWLIARRCAQPGGRTVCARIDFDVVHPVTAVRLPWLLLVEIATQLDSQLPGAPFQEFLASFGSYRALLNRVAQDATALPTPAPGDDVEVPGRFFDVLRELPADRRMLIVLDTLEEATGPAINPISIFELVAALLAQTPAARVLLSGRWDLCSRVPQITKTLPDMTSLQVPPLSEAEQRRYLTVVRAIGSAEIIEEIIRLSEGRPLTVATYANLVKQSDSVTAEVLSSFKTAGLVYALGRVVERIENDQLQWLIRYGVVPRKLSFDFVRRVLPPYLRSGMAGASALDDPKLDKRPQDRPREIFRTGVPAPLDEADLRKLWEQLLGYAEEYGWVSVQSDDRQLVEFRGEVLEPLRGLLGTHDVFRELHAKAAEFYEALSTERLKLRREAVYHRFQLDHDAGATAWRAAIADAQAAGDDQVCLDLATDLLGRDYVDWKGEPRGHFSFQMMAEAQLERARAAAALAGRTEAGGRPGSGRHGSAHARWSDVEEGLSAATALDKARDDVMLSATALRVIQARLDTTRGKTAKEVGSLLSEHAQELSATERAESERALGQSLVDSDPAAACAHFTAAYDLARAAGNHRVAQSAALLLADTENKRSRHLEALAVLDQARADGLLRFDDVDANFTRAWSLLYAGRPLLAADVVENLMATDETNRAYWRVVTALCHYSAGDPQTAVSACNEALSAMAERVDAPAFGADLAHAVRGLALSALFGLPLGTDDLLSAAARSRDLRNFDDSASFKAYAANVLIRAVGDLSEAQQCLEEARELAPKVGSDGWLYSEIVSTRLDRELGAAGRGNKRAAQLRAALEGPSATPRLRAEALVASLAVADPGELDGLLTQLTDVLPGMTPPSTRLEALGELEYVPQLPATSQTALDRLVDLAVASAEDRTLPMGDADRRRQLAQLAEVFRVAGRRHDAAQALERAWLDSADPLAWWNWLVATERLGVIGDAELCPPDDALDQLSGYPMLVAAYRITLAQRRLSKDSPAAAWERLAPVSGLLAAVGRPTCWTAQFARIEAELARLADRETEAQHRAATAVRVFSRLGDRERSRKTAWQFELGEPISHDDSGTIELAIQFKDDDVEVFVGQANEQAPAITIPRRELDSSSWSWRSAMSAATISTNWWNWAGETGSRLLPRSLAYDLASAGPAGLDIRVVPRASELAAFPWELLRLDRDEEQPLLNTRGVATIYRSLPQDARAEAKVRALQIALRRLGHFDAVPDGYQGGRTRQALTSFQRAVDLPVTDTADERTWQALTESLRPARPDRPLRVLLLRPSAENELQRQRDAAASGAELIAAYRRLKARVDVVEDPTLERVWDYSRSKLASGVDLVHICATPRTARGSTVLDFGGKVSTRGSYWANGANELSVTAVGELLSVLSPDVLTPSVIVDVPRPQTASESARALLSRNLFAYQLLRLGRVPGVLATGLAAPEQQEQLTDAIITGIRSEGTFPAIARQIWGCQRARAGDDLRASLPFLTTALFLQRPPVTMLPLIIC